MISTGGLSDTHPGGAQRSPRADRTRSAILDASRRLFLERGYAGTTVHAIAEACGISRGGFYTYFKDKREVFGLLGDRAYRDLRAALAIWDTFTAPYRLAEVREFVRAYFDYMDRHGAFAMAAAFSAPDDEEFRRGNARMQTRIAWLLGQALGCEARHSPEVLGTAAFGLLDRCWHCARTQTVAVAQDEMIDVAADFLWRVGAESPEPSRDRL